MTSFARRRSSSRWSSRRWGFSRREPRGRSALSVRGPRFAGVQTETGQRGGRQGVVWTVLADALPTVTVPGRPPRVLDCGGGSGTFAVPLAHRGADVTVVDISADALATLERRAEEAGVAAGVHARQGDVEALPEVVPDDPFDLVLAHGILEV